MQIIRANQIGLLFAAAAALASSAAWAGDTGDASYVGAPPVKIVKPVKPKAPSVTPRIAPAVTEPVGVVRSRTWRIGRACAETSWSGMGLSWGWRARATARAASLRSRPPSTCCAASEINVNPGQITFKNIAAVMVTADSGVRPCQQPDRRHRLLDGRREVAAGRHAYPDAAAGRERRGVRRGAGRALHRRLQLWAGRLQRAEEPRCGRPIPKGAYVEQEVPTTLTDGATTSLTLRQADFTTASRIADAILKESRRPERARWTPAPSR